jgi:hypothetical protein
MRKFIYWISIALTMLVLANLACGLGGKEEPTATPAPPTATQAPTPTPKPTSTPEPIAPASDMVSVENETHGVRFSYPEDWSYEDILFFIVLSSVPDYSFDDEEMPEGVVMFIIAGSSDDLEVSDTAPEEIYEQLGGSGDTELLGEPVETTINGVPVQMAEFRATEEDETIHGRVAVYDDGEQASMVIAICPDELWDDHADVVDAILESIELFEGTGFDFGQQDVDLGEYRGALAYGDLISDEFLGDEAHTWSFDGAAGEYVTVILSPFGEDMDVAIQLLSSDDALLTEVDDAFSGEAEILLNYELPADDEYKIAVREFFDLPGEYELELRGGDEPLAAVVPPDAMEQGELVLDETFEATLAEGEKHAWFLYSAGVGDMVNITLTPAEGQDMDMTLSVIAPDGFIEVDELDDVSSGGAETVRCLVLGEPGDYIIVVDEYWDVAGDYSLYVSPCEEGMGLYDLVEMGALSLGELVMETLAEGEQHAWTFEAVAGDVIDIFLSPVDTGMDMVLSLSAPDGSLLLDQLDKTSIDEDEEVLGLELDLDGEYTVIVEEFWDEPGDYALSVNYAGDSEYELIDMGEIAYGDKMQGELLGGQYVHTWSLEGAAGDVVTIVVDPLTDDTDMQLALLDPDGELVFDLDDGGTDEEEKIDSYELLTTGTYIVAVAEYWDDYAEYELSVKRE